jgi:hypothetical protein
MQGRGGAPRRLGRRFFDGLLPSARPSAPAARATLFQVLQLGGAPTRDRGRGSSAEPLSPDAHAPSTRLGARRRRSASRLRAGTFGARRFLSDPLLDLRSTLPPIREVELIQQRLNIDAELTQIDQAARLRELEEAFVNVAASWAKRTGVSAAALREAGVPASVLRRAGLL